MNPTIQKLISLLALTGTLAAAEPARSGVAAVSQTPGCVAFWDFVKREPDGARRFTAHVPEGAKTDYPLDAVNYIKDHCATCHMPGSSHAFKKPQE
jgi:hypothetical protein